MSAQVKRAFAILSRSQAKKEREKPKERLWTREDMSPSRRHEHIPTIPELISQGVTPEALKKDMQFALKKYTKAYDQKQKEKLENDKKAQASQDKQKEPFYRICLGACYGVFGSYHGSMGKSSTGLKIAEEIKKFDKDTLQDAIKRLQKGELKGYPLQGYDSEYIQSVVNYLIAEIQSR